MALVTTSKSNGVATVKINRPDKLNAMNMDVAREIISVFKELDQDAETKVIIL
ncbi:MAG: enoyl-CoA hydratase-related protein, partial [Candidatus Nitrosotenuis sp.]